MEREKADFQGSGAVAAMNDRLLKEVEAEPDEVTRLKAAGQVAEEKHRQLEEVAERR